jgi:hypothetical protein
VARKGFTAGASAFGFTMCVCPLFRGREGVIAFLASTGKPDLRHVRTRANGQPAIGWYLRDPESEQYLPASLELLALEGDRVRG